MSSRRKSLLPLIFALLLALAGPALALAEVPHSIYPKGSTSSSLPIWISDEEASRGGNFRWELISAQDEESIRKRLDAHRAQRDKNRAEGNRYANDDCQLSFNIAGRHGLPNETIEDLIQYSEWIAIGTVTDVKQGLLGGRPASLLEVGVSKAVKGSVPEGSFLLGYPEGKVLIDDLWLCESSSFPGAVPEKSKRIIVFAYKGQRIEDWGIVFPRERDLVFEIGTDNVFLGDRNMAAAPSFSQLEARLLTLLGTGR